MVKTMRTLIIPAVAALLLAGCEGISVKKITSTRSSYAGEGIPWNLGMTKFSVTISRHVIECGNTMKVKVEPLAASYTVVDEDQRFLLNSKGWFATSDINAEYATNGLSTSLNTETSDQTGKVIGNVVGAVAKALVFVAASGGDGKPQIIPPPNNQICSEGVKAAVLKLYPKGEVPLRKKVEIATALLAQKNATVEIITSQLALKKDDEKLKAKLISALDAQEAARLDLHEQEKSLAYNLSITSHTQVVTWPDRSDEFQLKNHFQLPEVVMQKWAVSAADGRSVRANASVDLGLYMLDEDGTWTAGVQTAQQPEDQRKGFMGFFSGKEPKSKDAEHADGVPVRQPRLAKLLICIGEDCPETIKPDDEPNENHVAGIFNVLQAGQLARLPVEGGAFRTEAVAITLDSNGAPAKLKTQEKVAPAEALSATLKDAATQLAALPAALQEAELTKTKGETNQINADIALESAKATAGLQLATNTLTADTSFLTAQMANATAIHNASLQGLQLQQTSLAAQSGLLGAQAILATAQANAQILDQTSVLGAQTALINAQTAQINAAAALVKAQQIVP